MSHTFYSHHCIIPPDILRNVAENGDEKQREWAYKTIEESAQMRGQRAVMGLVAVAAAVPAGTKRRTIYDANHKTALPGKLVRGEGDPKNKDRAVNEAYDGAGKTYDFFLKVLERNSIDDRGLRLDSTVHYDVAYNNAFWNGSQMVYGDGDGKIFNGFTGCLDVIGHELTHGVTQYEAGLVYRNQPGALNESMSDIFGSLVKQYAKKQTADKADWLIGQGLLAKGIKGVALRSMKAPGTAYDDPLIGKDPQPDHMKNFVNTPRDNGGVHINSGIPNKAFYETAIRLGGKAWEKAGRIWYITLRDRLRPMSQFQDCANLTLAVAKELYGATSTEAKAVQEGWDAVGIKAV
ncbi:MAG: M4 family metallopeptidase [Blastocatellia bacterium]